MLPRRMALGLVLPGAFALTKQAVAQGTILAPFGVMRAVYLAGNPVQAVGDPATGAVRGIAYDLARELTRRADVGLSFSARPGIAAVIDAVRGGVADIGFLADDPSRHGPVLFSQTYLRNPQSLVVADLAKLDGLGTIDRAGLRIGAGRHDSVGLHLARTLRAATFVPLDIVTPAAIAQHFADGTLDAFGASRLRLRQFAASIPGLHVLPGSIFGVPQAIIVPAEAPARLALVNAFLNAVRRDGFLAAAIARSDTEAEIEPAP